MNSLLLTTTRLGDIAKYVRGINFKPDDKVTPGTIGSVVCMRTKNIQEDIDESDLIAVARSFVKRKEQYLHTKDILISSANSWNLVGKCAQVPSLNYVATAGGFISIVRANSNRVDADYLFRWLTFDRTQHIVRRCARQTTNIANLDVNQFLNLDVPLPPLPEQQRIANILGRADRLRRLRRYALELSEGYLQAVFLEMFYSNQQPDWPVTKIENLAQARKNSIRTGPFGSQLLHSEFVDEGIAVLGIDNAVQNRFVWAKLRYISAEKYEKLKRYTVIPGDVIITIMGTTGRCAVVPDDIPTAINTKHLCCITCDQSKCLPVFLKWAFLTHPSVQRQMGDAKRGAIMPGLNMEIIKELEFPLPVIAQQQRFADVVRNADRLYSQQREALRQAEQLFQVLLQRAFAGEAPHT